MKLRTSCQNCKQEISFYSYARDRYRLSLKRGESFDLMCKKCKHNGSYHVDDVVAEASKVKSIFAIAVFVIGTYLTYIFFAPSFFNINNVYANAYMVSLIGTPFIIFLLIKKNEEKRVRTFNKYQLKGKNRQ